MAALADQDRFDLWAEFMREASALGITFPITKPELRAAANALDDYLSANAAAINNAIPQPARGQLSQAAKAYLLVKVVHRRYLKGTV